MTGAPRLLPLAEATGRKAGEAGKAGHAIGAPRTAGNIDLPLISFYEAPRASMEASFRRPIGGR